MMERNFKFIKKEDKQDNEQIRESLTYWKDAWRRLKKNKLSMVGLVGVIFIILFGVFGPFLSPYNYSDQENDYLNLPPRMGVYKVEENANVYLSGQYFLILVDDKGHLVDRLDIARKDIPNRTYYYSYKDDEIAIDFSYRALDPEGDIDYTVTYKGETVEHPTSTVWNKNYLLGTDSLGRDILTRLMYGARISLTVAFVATMVMLFIGVTYGSIAGFEGGKVDNVMMRIVDIINSIPLVIYVILLMVILNKSNLWTVILALASVYWVGMARLVRGQILGLKEQEFVLAARVIGVSKFRIISRHLIPNALGPIIVSMTMMIPTAIFTEAFLSFIGIGISAPAASWGTMANDSIQSLEIYPYQMIYPSLAIGITVLAFNFLGDGLRSALDPRLRKG